MANDLSVTPGAGAVVATNVIGSGASAHTGAHVQLMKLIDGTADSVQPLTVDLNGLARVKTVEQTDVIAVGTTLVTPKFKFGNVAGNSTDTNLVTAVASKQIRVIALVASTSATAATLTFNSKGAGAGTAISATFNNGGNGGEVLGPCIYGWFQTNVSEALTCTTGAGSTTGIQVVYLEV